MKLDKYVFVARLAPCLIVMLPVILGFSSWFPKLIRDWQIVFSGGMLLGLSSLLSQLGRDLGKNKEEKLYRVWGGKPTTQLLRLSFDEPKTKLIRVRIRTKLAHLAKIEFPTVESELANPSAADDVYDLAVGILRQKTRGTNYGLLLSENISYGFRRNLWSMRVLGAIVAVLGAVSAFLAACWASGSPALPVGLGGICLLLLTLYLFVFTKSWVRLTAFSYAHQLLASAELVADEIPLVPKEPSLIIT